MVCSEICNSSKVKNLRLQMPGSGTFLQSRHVSILCLLRQEAGRVFTLPYILQEYVVAANFLKWHTFSSKLTSKWRGTVLAFYRIKILTYSPPQDWIRMHQFYLFLYLFVLETKPSYKNCVCGKIVLGLF